MRRLLPNILSLNARLLVAGSIVLGAFLGLTGYALDQTYQRSAKQSEEERLLGHVMTLIAAAQVKLDGTIIMPEVLRLNRFRDVVSGVYGIITDDRGVETWKSPSLRENSFPTVQLFNVTESKFDIVQDTQGQPLFRLSYAVTWDVVNTSNIYTISIAQSTETYENEIRRFRQLLVYWLGGVSLVLLTAQGLILRWSLSPLRKAAEEIVNIEKGNQVKLEGAYPKELKTLTYNLNALIESNKEHLLRHRNALSDLAHSLKTPLAVLRSAYESKATPEEIHNALTEQVDQMQDIVDYQLQRAATSGRIPLSKPVNVAQVLNKITSSLGKVYIDKAVNCEIDADTEILFYGDESDLFEMLGNLLDNAFKWCKSRIKIKITSIEFQSHIALTFYIEDDGPGIDQQLADSVMERGVSSEKKEGTGIGLAIVKDIIDTYDAALHITQSELGGAKFIIRFNHDH